MDAAVLGNAHEKPEQVRFETSDGIDDIVIVTPQRKILIQAKNSISLSKGDGSDFAKVIRQFVIQAGHGARDDHYVIAVSLAASSMIRIILRKLCESYRLNDSGAGENPLTEDETEALEIVNTRIQREYQHLTGRACTERYRVDLLKQIYVRTLDVAEGGATELLAVTALAPASLADPTLLWRNLITICLTLARDRLSIDADGLSTRISALIRQSASRREDAESSGISGVSIKRRGVTSMGREVILARDENGRLILTDFRRFGEDGTKRLRFASGFLELPRGVRWQVIRRTATFTGMEREIEDRGLVQRKDDVLVIETSLGDLDDEPVAKAHAAAHDRRMRELPNPMTCIACGRPISENNSYEIEIDEIGHPYEVGMVHRDCLMPTHRILGILENEVFAKNPNLVDFDFQTWVRNLKSGQGVFNWWRESGRTGVIPIAWNPDNAKAATGSFGVAYELDDGTTHYVTTRGKVHRMTRRQAEQAAEELNNSITLARGSGNPFCVASDGTFGPYSALVSPQDPNPSRVIAAHAQALTQATVEAHKKVDNYYAPLFYMTSRETGQIFNIENAVILLSNPLQSDSMTENWKNAEITFPLYSTTILAEDRDFDLFMRELQHDSMVAVVDPIFNASGQQIGGFLIAPFIDIQDVLIRDSEKRDDSSTPYPPQA
jgi:hypothetical protein